MDWKTTVLKEAAARGAQLRQATTQLGHTSAELLTRAQHSELVRQGARVARVAATSLPVKELAVMCGRAGVAGAVVDGGVGAAHALRALHKGAIDGKQAAKHIASEAGCGFVTSTAGTAGTLAAYMITGAMGPAALIAGAGASMGSRYLYRRVVGETLPSGGAQDAPRQADGHEPPSQEGSQGQAASALEDIGPSQP